MTKILVIDDEIGIRQSFSDFLEDLNYQVYTATDGENALEIIKEKNIDLVLTDLRMPKMDGLEFMRQCKALNIDLPVIIISGANRIDDVAQALRLGAWDYLIKPVVNMSILEHAVNRSIEKLNLIKKNNAYKNHLEALVEERTHELEKRNKQLETSQQQIIGILSQAAEFKDFETGNHFLRVSEYSACIARGMGWTEKEIHEIKLASPVHDIGKLGIPDDVLLKKGQLSDEEWRIMKKHCQYGYGILAINRFVKNFCNANTPVLDDDIFCKIIPLAADIALSHHEHFDGNGYPNKLKGEEIPIMARITAVADVFDALGSKRPYKEAWSDEACISYIEEKSGSQFDPLVVKSFLENIEQIQEIKKKYKD